MSFLPLVNLRFFPSSHDLRQKGTVQDNRYFRTSKTKREERDTPAEEVLSPARHQGTHTALLRGH